MRVVSCVLLALCSSLVLGQPDMDWENYNAMAKEMSMGDGIDCEWVKEQVRTILDSSTDSGFTTMIDSLLSAEIEDSFCFDTTVECTESKYLGCACQDVFQQADSCADVPCATYQFLYSNLNIALNKFVDEAENMEDGMTIFAEYVYVPLMSIFCDCTELSSATFQCIEEYDGSIMVETGIDSMYRIIVGMLDLQSMEMVVAAMIEPHCQPADVYEENLCFVEFAQKMSTWGAMVDNIFDPEVKKNSCNSFKRIEKEVKRLGKTMQAKNINVKKLVSAYMAMQKKAACSPKCQETIAESFYSCCSSNIPRINEDYELVDNLDRVFNNLFDLASMGEMGGDYSAPDKKEIRKFLSAYDPAKLCKKLGGEDNFYSQINAQCDAEWM